MSDALEPGISLASLPTDILDNIVESLDAPDLSMLACTCKFFASKALDDNLWHVLCSRRWRHWSPLQIARSWHNKFSNRWLMDKQAEKLMQDIMFPRRTYTCLAGMRAMREDMLDFLSAASKVKGAFIESEESLIPEAKKNLLSPQWKEWKKEGQIFWATFALRDIQSWLCAQQMRELLATETEDNYIHVEQGALLLAQLHFPGEDLSPISAFLDELAEELKRRMQAKDISGGLPALELLSELLFAPEARDSHNGAPHESYRPDPDPLDFSHLKLPETGHGLGLQGESRDYYRASNSLLPCVLTRKKGIPISLAVVHAAVGRRAGLPIDCIGMPMHLINRMLVPGSDQERYIDVFRGGQLLTREQVNAMMVALMDSVAPNLLQPLSRADLYMRMCVNLCHIYRVSAATHQPEMLRSVLELLLACNEVIDYRRMHCAVCEEMGDYDSVRDDLEKMVPGASSQGQFAMSLVRREQEVASESNRRIRRPSNESVRYRVGDIMEHARYGYRGIIYGWDATCTAGDDWIAQMNVNALPGGRDQPFYHVLVDIGSRPYQSTYVAQENINLFADLAMGRVGGMPVPVKHPEVGRYFEGLQPGRTRYTPNAYLRFRYPDD